MLALGASCCNMLLVIAAPVWVVAPEVYTIETFEPAKFILVRVKYPAAPTGNRLTRSRLVIYNGFASFKVYLT